MKIVIVIIIMLAKFDLSHADRVEKCRGVQYVRSLRNFFGNRGKSETGENASLPQRGWTVLDAPVKMYRLERLPQCILFRGGCSAEI